MESALFDVTPAQQPSPNGIHNFSDPENMFPVIKLTLSVCLGASSIAVILRICSHFFVMKAHGWEDYTIIVAWLCFVGYTVLGALTMNYGSGVHQWDMSLSTFFVFLKFANIMEVLYNPLIFITKLSILLQYHRIFCPHGFGWTQRIIYTLIGFNFLFYTAVMIPQILACNPREKIWHPYLSGTCLDLPRILISGAVVNIISDFSILILPLFKIWHLQLSRLKKLGVSAIFAFGILACLASILRLVNNVRFSHTQDVTWDLSPVALWTVAEITCGIICGCLPALPLIFKHIGPKLKSAFSSMSFRKSAVTIDTSICAVDGRNKKGLYIEMHDRAGSSESQKAFAPRV